MGLTLAEILHLLADSVHIPEDVRAQVHDSVTALYRNDTSEAA